MGEKYLYFTFFLFILVCCFLFVKNKNFILEKIIFHENVIIENNKDSKYAVYVKYPYLDNLNNQESQDKINQLLKTAIDQQIASFKTESNIHNNNSNPKAKLKFMLFIRHSFEPTKNTLVSIPLFVSIFNNQYRSKIYNLTINYDILSNKEVTLKELFTTNSNYLEVLSQRASEDLKKQLPNPSYWIQIEKGTEPKEENFRIFSLNPDSLFLYFNSPQVAPAIERTKVVRIYYKEIEHLFNKQYLPTK